MTALEYYVVINNVVDMLYGPQEMFACFHSEHSNRIESRTAILAFSVDVWCRNLKFDVIWEALLQNIIKEI